VNKRGQERGDVFITHPKWQYLPARIGAGEQARPDWVQHSQEEECSTMNQRNQVMIRRRASNEGHTLCEAEEEGNEKGGVSLE